MAHLNDTNINGNFSVNNNTMVDYVVEQGISGIWRYRKWSSGIAECWGKYSAELSPYSTNNYLIPKQTYPFLFTEEPIDTASITVGNGLAYQANTYGNTDGFSCVVASNLNTKVYVTARIFVVGMWK